LGGKEDNIMAGGYGFWQGAERATGQMAATGMQLLQYQGQQRHREAMEMESTARLQLAKDAADIQNAKQNIELREREKEEARLNTGWEPAIDPIINKLPETDRHDWLDRISKMKIPFTQRGREQFKELMASDTKLFSDYSKSAYNKTMSDYQAIETEYTAALQKDPKKAAEIKPRYDAAAQAVHQQRGMIDQGFKMVGMAEAWGKLSEEVKQDPAVAAAFEMGLRTGDDTQFNKVLLERMKLEKTGATQKGLDERARAVQEGLDRRAAEANRTRIQAANIAAGKVSGGETGVNVTIYNVKEPTKTKKVFVKKGEDYEPPEGWTLNKPGKKSTIAEDLGLTESNHPLVGQQPGRYKVDGILVNWDGNKEI